MKRTALLFYTALAIVISINLHCTKTTQPEPENMNKHLFGKVFDRYDNTIVPNCTVSLYEGRFDGGNMRYTKFAEQTTGSYGKYDFRFTRKPDVLTYVFNLDRTPPGFVCDYVFTGLNDIPDAIMKKSEIDFDIPTVSFGELKVRFIGDGTGNKVILGDGGGGGREYYHGCDTIAWWSNESGKPAKFSYAVFGQKDTVNYEINDIMIKFGTVYKEVHF